MDVQVKAQEQSRNRVAAAFPGDRGLEFPWETSKTARRMCTTDQHRTDGFVHRLYLHTRLIFCEPGRAWPAVMRTRTWLSNNHTVPAVGIAQLEEQWYGLVIGRPRVRSENPDRSGGRFLFFFFSFFAESTVNSYPRITQWHGKDPCNSAKSASEGYGLARIYT